MAKRWFRGPSFYETTFDATENPISEGGRWLSGLQDGGFWSDIRTSAGLGAYGTQTGAVSPPYDDSCAYLLPEAGRVWRANQTVEAQVFVTTRSGWTGFHECLLLLRGTLSEDFNQCYECLFPATPSTWNLHELVIWKGPPGENPGGAGGNPDTFTVLDSTTDWAGLNDGDWIKASIIGTVIRTYHRTDSGSYGDPIVTYDTAGDALKIARGNPGFGHWKNGAGNLQDHGFRRWRCWA